MNYWILFRHIKWVCYLKCFLSVLIAHIVRITCRLSENKLPSHDIAPSKRDRKYTVNCEIEAKGLHPLPFSQIFKKSLYFSNSERWIHFNYRFSVSNARTVNFSTDNKNSTSIWHPHFSLSRYNHSNVAISVWNVQASFEPFTHCMASFMSHLITYISFIYLPRKCILPMSIPLAYIVAIVQYCNFIGLHASSSLFHSQQIVHKHIISARTPAKDCFISVQQAWIFAYLIGE